MNREEWDKLSEEFKWTLYNIESRINNNNSDNNLHCIRKKDTREDNSEECYYNEEYWTYINPFNTKQNMYVNETGFSVVSINNNWNSNKSYKMKSVWQKVESIKELKIGDFIRAYDYDNEKNEMDSKGIITKIIDSYITYQYFDEDGVGYEEFEFRLYEEIEKAVLVEVK